MLSSFCITAPHRDDEMHEHDPPIREKSFVIYHDRCRLSAGRPFPLLCLSLILSPLRHTMAWSKDTKNTIIMKEMVTNSDEDDAIEDTDVYLSPRNADKKSTISFDSHLPTHSNTWSGDGEEHGSDPNSSTARTPPRKLRNAIRATRAQPQDVESYSARTENNHVRPRHILKIFLCNKEDFAEISPEQVDRVKTSK